MKVFVRAITCGIFVFFLALGSVAADQVTDSTKQKVWRPKVELYATQWCGYCAKARRFLKMYKIEFTEYDIENDRKAAGRHARLAPRGGIPVLVVGDKEPVVGWEKYAYLEALGIPRQR